ncbi:MAG: T9SS type A sorting domain-containing protein [Bacteroidales bacterium]|nr:T9SS type A sorting domain-containing protein [Bacteroidales bacterium]MDD4213683.1 T9SS type A sorting domain-containing protein [Bacteroidales bacterium]
MKNKFIIILVLGVFAGPQLFSQPSLKPFVVASSGGYYTSAAGSLSATVAEMTMVQTFSAASNFLTQGFQQPGEWYASVKEDKPTNGINTYPNPNNGKFCFVVNSQQKGSAVINVYDILGRKTVSEKMNLNPGINSTSIDIRGSAIGIYLLEYLFTYENGRKEAKVIKINLAY